MLSTKCGMGNRRHFVACPSSGDANAPINQRVRRRFVPNTKTGNYEKRMPPLRPALQPFAANRALTPRLLPLSQGSGLCRQRSALRILNTSHMRLEDAPIERSRCSALAKYLRTRDNRTTSLADSYSGPIFEPSDANARRQTSFWTHDCHVADMQRALRQDNAFALAATHGCTRRRNKLLHIVHAFHHNSITPPNDLQYTSFFPDIARWAADHLHVVAAKNSPLSRWYGRLSFWRTRGTNAIQHRLESAAHLCGGHTNVPTRRVQRRPACKPA